MSERLIGAVGALRLAQMLREVPEDIRRELARELNALGQDVRATAAANASWSRRIPRSLNVRTTFGNRAGVTITARSAVAPHARPFEGVGGNAAFRHPLFGDRETWVNQATRPYLLDAADAHRPALVRAAVEAIDAALTRSRLT